MTLTDSYSCFLKIQKVAVKKSKLVIKAMVKMFESLPKHTVTPDRGKEFTYHQKLSDQLNIEVYFFDPHVHGNEEPMRTRMDYLENIFQKGAI